MKKYVLSIPARGYENPPCQDRELHDLHFRDFVQMLLCLAWSIDFLEPYLWSDIPEIARAAEIHDVGKLALPAEVINKSGRLTHEEKSVVKTHTVLGPMLIERAVQNLKYEPACQYALEIARHHHERIDGRGYPDRLFGAEIPRYVQVVSLADAYDSLRSRRCYRASVSSEAAMKMIRQGECGAFDPVLLDNLLLPMEGFRLLARDLSKVTDEMI